MIFEIFFISSYVCLPASELILIPIKEAAQVEIVWVGIS